MISEVVFNWMMIGTMLVSSGIGYFAGSSKFFKEQPAPKKRYEMLEQYRSN